MAESQLDRIVFILSDNQWHCGNEFLAEYMPRYSAVIHTLRHKRGYDIEGEPCTLGHATASHNVFMFRIKAYPAGQRMEQSSWIT